MPNTAIAVPTPAASMATFANIVTDNLDGTTIEVSGGSAATLHRLEVARGWVEATT